MSGNMASEGGGIYNDQGTVTLNGSSAISDNSATQGGGIHNDNGTLMASPRPPARHARRYERLQRLLQYARQRLPVAVK